MCDGGQTALTERRYPFGWTQTEEEGHGENCRVSLPSRDKGTFVLACVSVCVCTFYCLLKIKSACENAKGNFTPKKDVGRNRSKQILKRG